MFDLVLNLEPGQDLDINAMKAQVRDYATKITKDEEYDKVRDELRAKCLVQPKATPKPTAEATETAGAQS